MVGKIVYGVIGLCPFPVDCVGKFVIVFAIVRSRKFMLLLFSNTVVNSSKELICLSVHWKRL